MSPDMEYIVDQVKAVLAIDSPTSYTKAAASYVLEEYRRLGFQPEMTAKGGVLVCLNPEPGRRTVCCSGPPGHSGGHGGGNRWRRRPAADQLGGHEPQQRRGGKRPVVTRSARCIPGTCQLKNASVHVNGDYATAKCVLGTRLEVVLDEEAYTKQDVEALGVMTGDVVCFDPRTTVTPSGYIKSRFLDDKLSVAILLGQASGWWRAKPP